MGNEFMLQGCLRLDEKQIPKNLEIGKKYFFEKQGHRIYQINVPMNLHTDDWKALGRCVITEFTVGNGKTKGFFVMVKIFDKTQAKQVTDTIVSNEDVQEILKKVK